MTLQEFREKTKNKIFSATFIKKNGERRHMVARLGVTKHLKGGVLMYDSEAANNLIVFDMQKKAYRTIPFDRLIDIKIGGKMYDSSGQEILPEVLGDTVQQQEMKE